jgi:outer membrane protein assembly factor BamB
MSELNSNEPKAVTDLNPTTDVDLATGDTRKLSSWILLAMPVGIGLCLSFVVSFFQWLQEENTRLLFVGLDGMRFPLAIGAMVACLLIVALFLVRPKFKTLAISAMAIFAIGYGCSKVFRVDSYYGNRTPRLTWRWNPTPEEKVKSYLISTMTSRTGIPTQNVFLPTEHDFPGFLGGNRNAKIDTLNLGSDWERHPPRLLWRHPVGLGWSGFAVVGNAAVNLEQRDENECVVCYDVRSGVELWCHQETARFKNDHGDGPRSTPTIYQGKVLSMGGTGILTCIDLASGELLWKRASFADSDKQNLLFGMTGSPLVVDDQVVVTPGAGPGSAAICYSIATGKEVWRNGDDPAAYASLIEVTLCGERQLLSFNGAGLRSYDVQGNPLWLQPWLTQGEARVNVAQPVVVESNPENSQPEHGARVLISSGYDHGSALLKISRQGDQWESEVVWESKQLKSKLSNFVVFGDHIYGLDNGLLTCIDLKDGRRVWKRGRYGHGQMLLVRDKLLIQSESGEVVLVAASPDSLHEITKFPALTSKTWNHVALAGRILVVRNDHEAAAYELPLN